MKPILHVNTIEAVQLAKLPESIMAILSLVGMSAVVIRPGVWRVGKVVYPENRLCGYFEFVGAQYIKSLELAEWQRALGVLFDDRTRAEPMI